MRRSTSMAVALAAAATAAVYPAPAAAERIGGFDIVRHDVCGEGSAAVDSSPIVAMDAVCTIGGPFQPFGNDFAASVSSSPGSGGATAIGAGGSHASEIGNGFLLFVELTAGYFPSGFPGGDNPGGSAESELSSIVEFVMPVEVVPWNYQLLVREDLPFQPFHGTTLVTVENVSQSMKLLQLDSEVHAVKTMLRAQEGDIIRVTTTTNGMGDTMGPDATRRYTVDFRMAFWIPEPTSFALTMISLAALALRRR